MRRAVIAQPELELGIGDDDAGATLAAGVDVDGELVLRLGLTGARTGGLCDGAVDLTTDLADAVARGVSGGCPGVIWRVFAGVGRAHTCHE